MNIVKLLKVSKAVTGFVASATTGVVIDNVVKATTPAELTKLQKYMVRAGGFFVSFTVSGLIADRVEAGFDKLIKSIETDRESVDVKFAEFLDTMTPSEQQLLAQHLGDKVRDILTEEADDQKGEN